MVFVLPHILLTAFAAYKFQYKDPDGNVGDES